jgi:hypothetical protein
VDQTTAAQTKAPASKTEQTSQTPQTPTDTVTLSKATAILKEVQETHVQTVQEAAGGDNQAKRLLAKEAAAAFQPKK